MVESVLRLLEAGLSLWTSKEKTKYLDRVLELKKLYYEEFNKSPDVRSDAVLGNIKYELRHISDSFATEVGVAGTQSKS